MANTRGNLVWGIYLSDSGLLYRVRLTEVVANAGGFAKINDDAAVLKDYPIWPVQVSRLRNVRLVYFTDGGKRINRFLPLASPTNDHYLLRNVDVALDGRNYKVASAYGEIRPANKFIWNLSGNL